MEEEEYHTKIKDIQNKADMEIKSVKIEFAKSNSSVKVGDIIEQGRKKIKVGNIKVSQSFGLPECVYIGLRLRRDGTPFESGETDIFHQCNL